MDQSTAGGQVNSEQVGGMKSLDGREVLAWFNPEIAESIVVTNSNRTNPICVARSENPLALENLIAPESGTLGRELARIEGQASHMKTRFNVVRAKFPLPQRQLLANANSTCLAFRSTLAKRPLPPERMTAGGARPQTKTRPDVGHSNCDGR